MAKKEEEKKELEFGCFETAEELNSKAAELLLKGDKDGVKRLAAENGIDPEDAEDFMDGVTDRFCTPLMLARAKIDKECKELQIFGAFATWKGYLMEECIKDKSMQIAVTKKDKTMVDAFAYALKRESLNRKTIDAKIAKAAGLPEGIQISTLTKRDQIKNLRAYFMEDQDGSRV